jgi:diguanylate cyclase (GGDEF)-like protein/PAS domain S-box-containing protein
MTLSRIKIGIIPKTVIVVASTLAAIVIALFCFSRFIILEKYLKLEEESTIQSIEQVKNIFDAKIDEIAASTEDNATWDESYFFMTNNDTSYIVSFFSNATFDNLDINFYVLIDRNKKIKYIVAYDLENRRHIEATKSFQESLLTEVGTLEQNQQILKRQGVLLLDDKPTIVAIRPVLKTNGIGPQTGTLVTGRYIDKSFENDISLKTEYPVNLFNVNDPEVKLNFGEILNNFSKPDVILRNNIDIEYFSDNQLDAYYLIKDTNGNPILLMHMALPRDLYLEGNTATWEFIIFLIATAIFSCVLITISLRKLVLSRITKLSKEVVKFGKNHASSSELALIPAIPVLGTDEVSNLAESINGMLADLRFDEQQLRESENKFKDLIELLPEIVIELDKDNKITFANTIFFETLGYAKKDIEKGINVRDILTSVDLEKAEGRIDRIKHGKKLGSTEYLLVKRDGTTFPALISSQVKMDDKGNVNGIRSVIIDNTERKIMQDAIEKLAYNDPLTSLPNRILFDDRLKFVMANAARHNKKFAFIVIDLDKFKKINDKYGHKTGDEMLVFVGNRIEGMLRKNDTIARFGGDEFMLLLTEINDKKDAATVAEKILETFKEQFSLGDYKLSIGISMGISFYPDDGIDSDTLFRKADAALYQVKESGRDNYKFFTS